MNSAKLAGIVLLAAGVLALAYGGFSYTKNSHDAHIGSLSLSVQDKKHVNVPVWAGVAAVVIGAGFIFVPAGRT
jgi:TRAP-type C4-dicarboxylate transport system permease small subunit